MAPKGARHGAENRLGSVRQVRWIGALGVAWLLVAAACTTGPDPDQNPQGSDWQTVFEDLPGALISVWGSSADDIYAVGADPDDGTGPLVLHLHNNTWRRLATGQTGDLWWVHGLPNGDVFLGGEGGMILRYRNGTFERMTTPGTLTVFGIWGTSETDLWAVGGEPVGSTGAFIWRFNGTEWSAVQGLPPDSDAPAYFKVWGRSASDVFIVGAAGKVLHYDGNDFTLVQSNTPRTLLTVHTAGPGEPFIAVGGFGNGLILQCDGAQTGCTDVTPSAETPQMLGVWMTEGGGWAAGYDGSVLRYDGSAWVSEDTGISTSLGYHSVFVDSSGGVWVAGGFIVAFPLVDGILIHKGPAVPGGTYAQ